jgi:hypothetical protein
LNKVAIPRSVTRNLFLDLGGVTMLVSLHRGNH